MPEVHDADASAAAAAAAADPAEADAVVEIENVRVVVRVRPMDKAERTAGSQNVVHVDQLTRSISVTKPAGYQQTSSLASAGSAGSGAGSSEPPKVYYFDSVFGEESSQIDLYVDTARPIVDKVLEGYNGTILAYGQTGTGKTYTMSGNADSPQTKGILPNTFAHIFGHIAKAKDNQKFLVRVSYMEIYNEEVRDLLGKEMSKSLEVKERADIGVYVKDLSGYVVHNADDLDNIMKLGNKKRMVGATKMNVESSRSHAIFSITVESSLKDEKGDEHVKMGKLQLVDLAGSERQSKTQASGIRLKEATKINLSLSVLGNVISALVDGKSTHIPYRNSKLTRLLQDSLGGNSKTVMCASISPADTNYVETISTLRYAGRAKSIQNRAHVNEEPKDALLRHFQEEIAELKKQLEEGQLLEEGGVSGEDDLGEEEEEEEEEDEAEDGDEEEADDDGVDGELEAVVEGELERRQAESDGTRARARALREKKKRRKSKVQNDAEESEKSEVAKELMEKKARETEKELNLAKTEQQQLMHKLQSLENKILQGGENLLEKAKAQETLLDNSIAELAMRTRNERELNKQLLEKQAERFNIEERYSTLQEECVGKTKKLHRVMQMLMGVKAELADQQQEQQREKEGIYESIRTLSRELALCELVIDSYIPREYWAMVERYTHWNEDIGEWQLKCVAYTGNNMHKSAASQGGGQHGKGLAAGSKGLAAGGCGAASGKEKLDLIDLSHVYLDYTRDSLCDSVRPDSAAAMRSSMSGSMTASMLARPRTGRHSGVPRPTTTAYKAAPM